MNEVMERNSTPHHTLLPPAAYEELRTYLRESGSTLSPAEAMVTAAKAMSDALNTALTLVEHANHQSQNTLERRLPRYRRAHDLMDDIH